MPDGILDGYGLIIKNDVIEAIIGEGASDYRRYDILVDGEGNYLAPGFIDIHNHGNSGYDVMDATEEALDKIGSYHISNGVTAYLGTIITASPEDMIKAGENIAAYKNKSAKAGLLGVHLEGPFFNKLKKGAQPEEYIKNPEIKLISDLMASSKNKLKMVSLAPELEGSGEVIEFLKKHNIAVAMGHSDASYAEAELAIGRGASIATHLFNAMKAFDHREPGITGAALTDDRVYCEIIYDRFHLHDAAVKLALRAKGYDRIVLVSDAMMAAGLEDGEYLLGGQEVFVKDKKPRLKSGSIAGSTLDLREAVRNMVRYQQVPLYKAVKMASLNPAEAIHMDKELGSIKVGKRADLILFDEDINIKKVFKEGRLI